MYFDQRTEKKISLSLALTGGLVNLRLFCKQMKLFTEKFIHSTYIVEPNICLKLCQDLLLPEIQYTQCTQKAYSWSQNFTIMQG